MRQREAPQYKQEQQQQNQYEQDTGPNWGYFKTPSFILRVIQICLLIPCLILMCISTIITLMATASKSGSNSNSTPNSTMSSQTFSTILSVCYYAYIAFAAVLIVFQITKIILNIANFGDYKPNNKSSAKCVNIALNVFEGLFYAGLALATIPMVAVVVLMNTLQTIVQLLDIDFFVSVGFAVLLIILRAVLGCVERCKCCKPRENQIRNSDQPVAAFPRRQY